jgi:hypothetical protein
MRRSCLLAFPLLATFACGDGTPTSINERPTLLVREMFGQIQIVNTSNYPLYTYAIDASDTRAAIVQAGNDADFTLLQPGASRAVEPEAVLGEKRIGKVRVWYFWDAQEAEGIQRAVTMQVVADVGLPNSR